MAEGETAGDGAATGDLVGDDDGDWAMVELTNNVAISINTTVYEAIVERWRKRFEKIVLKEYLKVDEEKSLGLKEYL
jgi:hypothetical protein